MARKKKTDISLKIQLYIATGAVLLLVLFGVFVAWLDSPVGTKQQSATVPALTGVTLKGEAVCVEHRNNDKPHTMECLMGLKTVKGSVYAIKGSEKAPKAGEALELTGTLAPATGDENYNIAGTLKVSK